MSAPNSYQRWMRDKRRYFVMLQTWTDELFTADGWPSRHLGEYSELVMASFTMRYLGTWLSDLLVWDAREQRVAARLQQPKPDAATDPIAPQVIDYHWLVADSDGVYRQRTYQVGTFYSLLESGRLPRD